MFYAADDHNQECDTDNEMYEYHPNILGNLNVIYFPHTVNKYNFKMKKKTKIIIILIGSLSSDIQTTNIHDDHLFLAATVNTYCKLHNERNYFFHRYGKFHIQYNDIDPYLHHQIDYK